VSATHVPGSRLKNLAGTGKGDNCRFQQHAAALQGLSLADIFRVLANLKRSGSRYLLTTSFIQLEDNNDIVPGDWRPLNLERPPFDLPPPLTYITEGCTEENGAFADKALELWEIVTLPDEPSIPFRGIAKSRKR
jgi:hypothetical protein